MRVTFDLPIPDCWELAGDGPIMVCNGVHCIKPTGQIVLSQGESFGWPVRKKESDYYKLGIDTLAAMSNGTVLKVGNEVLLVCQRSYGVVIKLTNDLFTLGNTSSVKNANIVEEIGRSNYVKARYCGGKEGC